MEKLKSLFREEFPFVAVVPALLWQLVFFALPLLFILGLSFFPHAPQETQQITFSLANYIKASQQGYLFAMANSLFLAYWTATLSFLFCLPLVLFLVFKVSERWRGIMLLSFMVPLWTNFIIRIYSWLFLLKSDGLFASFLYSFGLINDPSVLLANHWTVIVGMLYCYYPFMLIPLYSSACAIDKKVIEASIDLGASTLQTLRYIIIPLCRKGAISGFVVVALSVFGEFAIQDVLGGAKYFYWGNLIVSKFIWFCDYSLGAAVAITGVIVLLLSAVVFYPVAWLFFRLICCL